MKSPQRAALLAVCLMAAAGSAFAAFGCTAGSVQLDLVSPTSATNLVSKCMPSIKVAFSGDCKVTVTALSSGGIFAPGIWVGAANDAKTYDQLTECPTTAGTQTAAGTDEAGMKTNVATAISKYIYSGGLDTTTTITYDAAGKLTLTTSGQAMVYAVTKSTLTATQATDMIDANLVPTTGTGLTVDVNYRATTNLDQSCGAGKYGLPVGTIKVCALCPAGTTGNGWGCTAIVAGRSSGLATDPGADATTAGSACGAGTYGPGGTSACLPCPPGTYSSGAANSICTQCPLDSYAWLPGSIACARCVNGVPKCVRATGDTNAADCVNAEASSPGYHTLKQTGSTACTTTKVAELGDLKLWSTCTMEADNNLQLSLRVNGDCSIEIAPITKDSCVSPIASYSGVAYSDLVLTAYYTFPTITDASTRTVAIRSLLPATDDTIGITSYVLDITGSGSDVQTLTFWDASTKPSESGTVVNDACTAAFQAVGGQVNALPTTIVESTSCPDGTYSSSGGYADPGGIPYCTPCPMGHYCKAGIKTACPANKFNPYLGQSLLADCQDCATAGFTSNEGAAECTVPVVDILCRPGPDAAKGYEFDAASQTCQVCKAGTYRPTTAEGDAGDPICVDCPAGTYSEDGALGLAGCVACPIGQYNPSPGLAIQSSGAQKCLYCPEGSLPVVTDVAVDTTTTLATGAKFCSACPAGTIAKAPTAILLATDVCTRCDANYYRSGDATPENNECIKIPPGYKEIAGEGAVGDRAAIGLCEIGAISYWSDATTRMPATPEECKTCVTLEATKPSYAPREGMSECILAPAGFEVNTARTALVQCPDTEYRSYTMISSPECSSCAAGSEVRLARTSCTPCRAGFYSNGATNFCAECPRHRYAATPGTSVAVGSEATACTACPVGYQTQDTGNTECQPCPLGYFNDDEATACEPAPAGTFVNTTAAVMPVPCPYGTFTKEEGSEGCSTCPAGSYANSRGSTSCKTCPAGTFSKAQAATCRACPTGYFAAQGSSACQPCKPGTFASATRSESCALCPRGQQCPTQAMSAPRNCPKGYFSPKVGLKLCMPCPVNTISAGGAVVQCTKCGTGTNTRGMTGQSRCQAVRPQVRRLM